MKRYIVLFLVFCIQNLIFPINMVSYGEEVNSGYLSYNVSEEDKEKIIIEDIKNLKIIEDEMQINNTSVNEQLDNFLKEDLKYFTPEEAKLVEQTINENRPRGTTNIKTLAFLPDYKFDPETSDMTIANAAIAYFKLKNYKLSAHLLSRALSVRSSAEYQPSNSMKNFLYNTVAYKALSNKRSYPNGSVKWGEFQNTFNRDEADAHYAIYHFRADMTNNRVKIMDIYDYKEGSSSGAVGVAVDAIARLQRSGRFVAFPLRIHLVR